MTNRKVYHIISKQEFVASLMVAMPALLLLTLLFAVLLIPYIMYYYTLENEVQKMYDQYDRILEYIRRGKRSKSGEHTDERK